MAMAASIAAAAPGDRTKTETFQGLDRKVLSPRPCKPSDPSPTALRPADRYKYHRARITSTAA